MYEFRVGTLRSKLNLLDRHDKIIHALNLKSCLKKLDKDVEICLDKTLNEITKVVYNNKERISIQEYMEIMETLSENAKNLIDKIDLRSYYFEMQQEVSLYILSVRLGLTTKTFILDKKLSTQSYESYQIITK